MVSCSSRSSYSSQKRSDSNDAYYPQSKACRRIPHPAYPPSFTAALESKGSIKQEDDDASVARPVASEVRSLSGQRESPTCCTCRKSHCLKLYCACFKSQEYCNSDCTCYNCYNNARHEEEREDTISMMKAKNPHCFESHVDKKVMLVALCEI